jgi:hypothetical protein
MAKRTRKSTLAAVKEPPPEKGVTDDELVQIFHDMHRQAEDEFRPIQDIIDVAWAAYNNQFDFTDRDEQQSQAFLPIYKSAVRIAKSIVRRTLLEAPQYFAVEGLNKESKDVEKDIQDGLTRIADQANFREEVANASFGGFLENLAVLKIFPRSITDEDDIISAAQRIRLEVAPISVPNDFRLDPKGRNLYILHRTEMDIADYEELVDQDEYLRDSLDAAYAGFQAADEEFRIQRQNKQSTAAPPPWRKTVELWEVWTRALCSQEGPCIGRNQTFTILNRKHVARRARDYLYKIPKSPFVWSPVADKPFSVYHENFGEPVLGMLTAIIDLMNSLVDAAQNVATKGFEVSINEVRNPAEVSRGIYGGKVIKTTTPPIPGLNTIRPFDVGEFSPEAHLFLQFMIQQFQNGVGVTELISGIPGVGEKTATEITSKTRAAMGNLNEVAGLLDQHLISPAVRMMYELMLKWNPEVFGDRVGHQINKGKLKFRFNISGISGAIKQEGELQELLFVIKTLMGTPLATRLNWDHIGQELLKRKGFDPTKFIRAQPAPEPGKGPTTTQQDGAGAVSDLVSSLTQSK